MREYYEVAARLDPKNSNYLNQAGLVLSTLGDYDQAIAFYEKALASDIKTFGENHPSVARDWNNLGTAWYQKGEYDKAIEYLQKARAVLQRAKLQHLVDSVDEAIKIVLEARERQRGAKP